MASITNALQEIYNNVSKTVEADRALARIKERNAELVMKGYGSLEFVPLIERVHYAVTKYATPKEIIELEKLVDEALEENLVKPCRE